MKAIFRFLSFGALLAAAVAVAATSAIAQDACADVDGQTALYTKFTDSYAKKTVAELEPALAAGKEFLEKFGTCETLKDQVAFVQPQVQRIDKLLPDLRIAEKLRPLFGRFDNGIKADNADEVYAAGKEILAITPDNMNIIVPMGVIGMYQSTAANNYKYAEDGIQYATLALAKIKGGAEFTKQNKTGEKTAGALRYEYTKPAAINELTYSLAYLNFYGKKNEKAALPFYYELSQSSSPYKDDPRIYGAIGDYYVEQGAPIGEDIAKKIAARSPEDAADVLAQKEAEIKAQIALFNGYTERALDAYSRAYKVAKGDTTAGKAYKDNLYRIMQSLYKRRFDKDTGLDAYVASTLSKPFPNPTSDVTPISDPDPTATPASGVGTANGNGVGAASGNGLGTPGGTGIGAVSGNGMGTPAARVVDGANRAAPVGGKKPVSQSKPGTTAATKPRGAKN